MSFTGILDEVGGALPSPPGQPDYFSDLNLDQFLAELSVGRDEYNLSLLLHRLPERQETILYRQEIMKDLEQEPVLTPIQSFSKKMKLLRDQIAAMYKLHYQLQKERVFLDTVSVYRDAIVTLEDELMRVHLNSRGLTDFRDYLNRYIQSAYFERLCNNMQRLTSALERVEYSLFLHEGRITVRKRGPETDYSATITQTFARFSQDMTEDYTFKFRDYIEMNHIEAGILDFVARLFPDEFSQLHDYFSENEKYIDQTIDRWEHEVQFYLSYLEYIRPLKVKGLHFCYPAVSTTSKAIGVTNTFDIVLAHKLVKQDILVVTNDFRLSGEERILVVSGPNQGGKTTFARTFGQLHYLARLGYPVPGTEAYLYFFDKLLTHFEREEDVRTHHGKLEEEIIRIHDTLKVATPQSIVILNEVFTSTSFQDALFLSREVLDQLSRLDILCVCVTFLHELSRLNSKTVSFVSTVKPDDPTTRTYRIMRKSADGRSYAMSIAEKYRVTFDTLTERLAK